MTTSKGLRFVALGGAFVVLMVAAISAGSALAAKGGNGDGHGHGGFGTTPTCSVTPQTVPLDTGYSISGVGFSPGSVAVRVQTAAGTILTGAVVGEDGSFSVSMWAGAAGSYTVTVEQSVGRNSAVCPFSVTS